MSRTRLLKPAVSGLLPLALLLLAVEVFPLQAQPLEATISQIQGPGEISPLEGRTVTVRGVVTARRTNGFYIQSLASDDDNNPNTSEGILIFTQTAPATAVQFLALVQVTGTVTEFRPAADPGSPPLTELTQPSVAVIGQASAPTPAIPLPADGNWERFEGMRVNAGLLQIVGPTQGTLNERTGESTSNGVAYAVPAGLPRPYRRATERVPYVLRLDTRTLSAGPSNFNFSAQIRASGILDFGFRTYTLLTEGPIPQLRIAEITLVLPVPAANEFLIGSLNLQRLFDATDNSNGATVISQAGFDRRLARAAAYIRERMHMPDILAVQEVESQEVLNQLAAKLGPAYWAITATSNDPGSIRTGLIANTSAVTIESVGEYGKDAQFLAPGNTRPSTTMDRPMLVVRLRVGNQPLTVAVVHQRSLTDVETPFVRAKRQAQSELVAADLAEIQRAEPDRPLAVVGDWNAFEFDDRVVDVLGIVSRGAALRNLTDSLPVQERYSYVFDGQTQTLDHMLVNTAMLGLWSRLGYARGNADSAEVARNLNDAPVRVSDHDGLVAYFTRQPEPFTLASIRNSVSFLQAPLTVGGYFTIFGNDLGNGLGGDAPAQWQIEIGGQNQQPVFAGQNQLVGIFNSATLAADTTLAVRKNGQKLHEVKIAIAAVDPAIAADQANFVIANRVGNQFEIFGNGFGNSRDIANVTAFVCNLPAQVLERQPYRLRIQVSPDCPSGPQPFDIAFDDRWAQPHLLLRLP